MVISIKAARITRNITQREVAKALNVHRDTYRKIELNPDTATIEQAKKISKLLDVSYDELFFAS